MGATVSSIMRVPEGYAFTVIFDREVVTFVFDDFLVAELQSDLMRDLIDVAKTIKIHKPPRS